ncbi:unnamed protein product [Clonostachys rhizophaga]|uniref:F-box domain-containing protein n=1 Tax=Clonostachys rhizophaga TaxID=160324 RepID=A0A9N9V857_9HYPO|nr:unnamed protein product [Clonostachys rhizophaga]
MALQFMQNMKNSLLGILADINWDGSTPRLIKYRAPQKRDDSQPSLNSLGNELIVIIFDMVCTESPKSMKNLALVSSHYYHAARYYQHREICLDISESNKERLQQRLASIVKGGLSPAIRRINVRGDEYGENVDAVVQLLQKTTGLRDLEWMNNGPPVSSIGVPEQVIAALRPKKMVRLRTTLGQEIAVPLKPIPTFTSPLQLTGSENLYSLRMCLTFHRDENTSKMNQILKQILLSSPNVRKLAIDLGSRNLGRVIRPLRRYFGLGFVNGERPPALEELELHHYIFGNGKLSGDEKGRRGSCIGYPGKGLEMDYWVETFDWSMLRKLQTDSWDFALKLAPKLISLDEASFGQDTQRSKFSEFYRAVPNTLSTVRLPKVASLGVEGIVEHASKLKILHIHQEPIAIWGQLSIWAEETIDAPSLLKIQQECPLIEELALDIKRQDDWPYDILDILAGFPKLRSLTIWFELCSYNPAEFIHEPTEFIQPPLTYSAVEELFIYIRSKRPLSFPPLKELKFQCGTASLGPTLNRSYRPTPNISTYVCQPSERYEEAADGMFRITCLELTEDENAVLERMRYDAEAAPVDLSSGLRVAIHGPYLDEPPYDLFSTRLGESRKNKAATPGFFFPRPSVTGSNSQNP